MPLWPPRIWFTTVLLPDPEGAEKINTLFMVLLALKMVQKYEKIAKFADG